jgi:hypothetical protein
VKALNTITVEIINNLQAALIEPGSRPASGTDEEAARRSWTWLIGRLAPRNPRQLKRLHNRVVMEIDPKPNETQARPAHGQVGARRWDVLEEELRLIFTFILMVEVTHPELGLWGRVLAVDETLMDDLRMRRDDWPVDSWSTPTSSTSPHPTSSSGHRTTCWAGLWTPTPRGRGAPPPNDEVTDRLDVVVSGRQRRPWAAGLGAPRAGDLPRRRRRRAGEGCTSPVD